MLMPLTKIELLWNSKLLELHHAMVIAYVWAGLSALSPDRADLTTLSPIGDRADLTTLSPIGDRADLTTLSPIGSSTCFDRVANKSKK